VFPAPDVVDGNTLTWFINNAVIDGYFQFLLQTIHPGVEMIDSTLTHTVLVHATEQEVDSIFTNTWSSVLLCAYDPNIKEENTGYGEQGLVSGQEHLEYVVHFQNTGNYLATNVEILDQLSENLDYSSFEPIASSHTMEVEMSENGLLSVYFPYIMLPDSNSNEPESHGFVSYRIKPISDLPNGTVIENTAEIYFDFNPEIVTNTTHNTIYLCGTPGDYLPESVSVCTEYAVNIPFTADWPETYEWTYNGEIISSESELEYVFESDAMIYVTVESNLCVETDSVYVHVIPVSNTFIEEENCISFEFNGETYTSTGIYEQVFPNEAGCDSIITLDLTIHQPTSYNLSESSCDSYTLNGITYTSSGIYEQYLLNAAGCDSLITLDLDIQVVDIGISLNATTLTASEENAAYQWIDCGNNNEEIVGENEQTFTAGETGVYAVEITEGECSGLSDCVEVIVIGVKEDTTGELVIYPNPNGGDFMIKWNAQWGASGMISIYNVSGELVYTRNFTQTDSQVKIPNVEVGVYRVVLMVGSVISEASVVVE
jgi:uncharacterized repeat protein (TIGR01451 family)